MDTTMTVTVGAWWLLILFVMGFGACVGSFLNVCIYRIPLDQSVVSPRSRCMACGTPIAWYHNIPVASYFIVRGRCVACKAPFSIRYAVVETLTAALFATVWLCVPFTVEGTLMMPPLGMLAVPSLLTVPVYWLVLGGLIIGTFTDLDHLIIPDSVTWGGMVAGILLSALLPELHGETLWWRGLMMSAIGAGVGFGVLEAIAFTGTKALKKEAMGFGDVKLMGAVGAFFGWQAAAFVIVAGSLFGTVGGLALMAAKRARLGQGIPFGPYLALATIVWMFWGPRLVGAYLAFLAGN
ncbi:MAG: prepilin peptidase [Kiritimatiellaeota bacterium]|nr:prepilin peptidase [Kiritimatiellota bacterium]